jgi:ATP-dependent protease ClpP protease subunit
MTAKEALSFGIIDKIVERRPPSASEAEKKDKP